MTIKQALVVLSSVVMMGAVSSASLAADTKPIELQAREATPTAFDPIAHKRVVEVSEQLRCLVCQNQSIAESNAELAIDLRNQVIKQVKEGKTNKQIIDYMVERYGDFVLYKPPMNKTTLILWWGPVALVVIALAFFIMNLRRRKSQVAEKNKPLTAEEKALAEKLLNGNDKE